MKVVAPGTLYFAGGHSHMHGWFFDAEGSSAPLVELNRQALKAALLHVAQCHGITLTAPVAPAEPAERLDLESERSALDVIAMARWRPQP